MSIKALASEAIAVQDTCNPLGLTRRFAEVVVELRDELQRSGEYGTDAICRHPVFRLWVSKLHDLGRMGLSDLDRYGEAYQCCRDYQEGDELCTLPRCLSLCCGERKPQLTD